MQVRDAHRGVIPKTVPNQKIFQKLLNKKVVKSYRIRLKSFTMSQTISKPSLPLYFQSVWIFDLQALGFPITSTVIGTTTARMAKDLSIKMLTTTKMGILFLPKTILYSGYFLVSNLFFNYFSNLFLNYIYTYFSNLFLSIRLDFCLVQINTYGDEITGWRISFVG